MRRTMLVLPALVLALSVPAVAQDKAPTKEAVWVMTYSRGGGWSAAAKAAEVRETLKKMDGVDSVVVDTTATATLHMKAGKKPTKEAIGKALANVRFKPEVSSLEMVERLIPTVQYEVWLKGLGWGGTATQVRATLNKTAGVVAIYPHGDKGVCQILATDEAKITEEAITKAFEGSKFQVKKFAKTSLVKKTTEAGN